MSENPIVPLPTGPPQPHSLENSTTAPEEGADTSTIRCVCRVPEDDGFTVQCDTCHTWQHTVCMGYTKETLPDQYFCHLCSPRHIDAKKARELQTKNRRRNEEVPDQGPKTTKKKRSNTTSQKKRESPMATTVNGVLSNKPNQNSEKTLVAKLPSPKEQQLQTSRKRPRASQTTHLQPPSNGAPPSGTTPGINAASPSPGGSYFSDRNGDGESDNEAEKYRLEFNDITTNRDRYANHEVKTFLRDLLDKGACPDDRRFSKHEFMVNLPKLVVKPVPDESRYYSEHSRWCLSLETACSEGDPIGLFKGEVGFQEAYRSNSINHYSILQHPKPFVVFHPSLPVYIDARGWGSETRFIRRSCRPNLTLATAILEDSEESEVSFCLFATDSLKTGTELTLGWDWNGIPEMQHLVKEGFDFEKIPQNEMKQIATWVDILAEKMGDCACTGDNECLLNQIKKIGVPDSGESRPLVNGNGKKTRVKRKNSAEPAPSKDPSPSRSSAHPTEDDGEDAKTGSAKSRSRDLTPGSVADVAVEKGQMTGREARKFQDMLSRIEKQHQEEKQPQKPKRRKRNSTVSSQTGIQLDFVKGEGTKKYKSTSTQKDSPSLGSVREKRCSSHSSTSSEDRKQRRKDSESANGQYQSTNEATTKPDRSVKTNTKYVTTAIQTDPDDLDLPWWQQRVELSQSRPARMPLRKRLLQSLQRDREEAALVVAAGTDKKRKHDAVDSEALELVLVPQKVRKISDGTISNSSDPDISSKDTTQIANIAPNSKIPPQNNQTTDSSIHSTPQSPRPPGPSLADIFFDADSRDKSQGSNGLTVAKGHEQPQGNGVKPVGLHLQLPDSSGLLNGPCTPQTQGLPTPNSGPLQSPLALHSGVSTFSPSTVAAVGTPSVNPSPTKTKKLSLQDYGRRKKSTSVPDFNDEKPSVKPITDTTLSPAVPRSGLANGVLEEPRKFVDIFPSSLVPPSSETRLVLEEARIPTAPKEQRATHMGV